MNLADQIEATADRAVADLVAVRATHARRTRPVRDDNDTERTDDDGRDGRISASEDE